MKRMKTAMLVFFSLLAVFSIVLFPAALAVLLPPAYSNTFVGALDEKVARLSSIEGKKVVVIGGSSVAFGLDSALMEQHLGMPVVNFGLYAAIGTKAMLDISLPHIGEGDIVILAPETDTQTLSLYFNGENMWKAIDDAPSLFFSLRGDSKKEMLGALYPFAVEKLAALKNGISDPEGIYNSKSFNAYGDVAYPREQNVMPLYYDPNMEIHLDASIVSDAFVDYVNDYILRCQKKGATVYYSYAPMNEAAISQKTTEESMRKFESYLRDNILCKHISLVDSYIINKAYFYDTNYHLNDAGVRLRTKLLIEDIRIAQGIYQQANIELLPKPELPFFDVKYFGEDANAGYFVYETLQNGALSIVGLTDAGKLQQSLTIPLGAQNRKVMHIGARAFEGGAARSIVVPQQTNVRAFGRGAFDGCLAEELYILYDFSDEAQKLSPPSSFGSVSVYVRAGSTYLTHYDWSGYALFILESR